MTTATTTTLRHGKVELALHQLRGGDGRALLLLHGLGEASPTAVPPQVADAWPGPVHALDFTGHGASTVPSGGGYTAEFLMADADTALAHLGEVTVLGRGLGAYVGLMLAGARPEEVRGAILDDGPGLAGGGPRPMSAVLHRIDPAAPRPPDPYALAELSSDVRPPDYASTFVRQAVHLSGLDPCLAVAARVRPHWLDEVARQYGVVEEPLAAALTRFAAV
ncbi:alpha/beta fold hydrolase [Actinomarinicola tropica]|uniref:Alpha/beta fold hydrolase n=1 Tax=Actinomarinicola tropica TaxID=2789776 RepID=A0A5Q2RRT4_9ACTN|nr:alpha/beta fold hydrolase [Actinomarinicola tropica]QGG96610.1 alpha/beta fold hydrolase [Actinomarinicola tropica]